MTAAKKRAPAKKAPTRKKPGAKPAAQDKLTRRGIDAICADIADGKSMADIAKAADVSFGSVITWLQADPERSARAREAREKTARMWDEKAEDEIRMAGDPFELSKAKELSHHYRWRASKIAPKEYGDKTQVTGEGGGPVQVVVKSYLALDA